LGNTQVPFRKIFLRVFIILKQVKEKSFFSGLARKRVLAACFISLLLGAGVWKKKSELGNYNGHPYGDNEGISISQKRHISEDERSR